MKLLVSLLSLSLLFGCAADHSKKERKAFKNKVTQEKLKVIKDLGKSSKIRLPLKAGQWVKVHTVQKNGNKNQNLTTFKVLKVSGPTVVMEVETVNASTLSLNVMQYEIENYPFSSTLEVSKKDLEKRLDKMAIKRIVIKQGNNSAQELSKAHMARAKGLLKELFSSGYPTGEAKKEACSSPYLSSENCFIFHYKENTGYAHSAVPIVGFIKSDADNSHSVVINFGLTGAQSAL